MFNDILKSLMTGQNLKEEQMTAAISDIFAGSVSDAQIGAFLGALSAKGVTFAELAGAARAMRRKALKIQVNRPVVLDTVGTGGNRFKAFNISTTTSFVVAACGVTVAKHGNRSATSPCGSADLLEKLGVDLHVDPEIVEECIDATGIGFLFAPLYHKAMRAVAGLRKEIGAPTIFNLLGPLTNPAGANCQLLGVYAPEYTEMYAKAMQLLGTKRTMVVHGLDGIDEISVCGPTRVSEIKDGQLLSYDIRPELYFEDVAQPDDIRGGDPDVNAGITRAILAGKEHGPKRNIVLLNAAAALMISNKADDLRQGIKLAAEALDSGAAEAKLYAMMEFINNNR